MTRDQLIAAAHHACGGHLNDRPTDQLHELMTVAQFVTDLCLNEVERRGELEYINGAPVVPYISEFTVDTVLTRASKDLH